MKVNYSHSAIVLGVDYNGLGVIRELGENGINVYAFNPTRTFGTYSKYSKYINCPDPMISEKEFITFLINFGKKFSKKPIIFPSSDHWVLSITKYQYILEKFFILCSPQYSVVQLSSPINFNCSVQKESGLMIRLA